MKLETVLNLFICMNHAMILFLFTYVYVSFFSYRAGVSRDTNADHMFFFV